MPEYFYFVSPPASRTNGGAAGSTNDEAAITRVQGPPVPTLTIATGFVRRHSPPHRYRLMSFGNMERVKPYLLLVSAVFVFVVSWAAICVIWSFITCVIVVGHNLRVFFILFWFLRRFCVVCVTPCMDFAVDCMALAWYVCFWFSYYSVLYFTI